MEKIFCENRSLVFTSAKDPLDWAVQKDYTTMADLVDFARNDFRKFPNYSTIALDCHGKEEEIHEAFLRQFPIVEAGGGLVRCPDGKGGYEYLYIYRNLMWDLPKGKKEKGETDQENALREVEEETGLQELRILGFLKTTYHFIENKQGLALKKSNWFEMEVPRKQETKPQTEEGITQAIWLDPEGIKQRLPLMYASIAYLTGSYFSDPARLSK